MSLSLLNLDLLVVVLMIIVAIYFQSGLETIALLLINWHLDLLSTVAWDVTYPFASQLFAWWLLHWDWSFWLLPLNYYLAIFPIVCIELWVCSFYFPPGFICLLGHCMLFSLVVHGCTPCIAILPCVAHLALHFCLGCVAGVVSLVDLAALSLAMVASLSVSER